MPGDPLDGGSVDDGVGDVDDMTILDVGVPETDAEDPGVDDGKGVLVVAVVAVVMACLTTIRAPSARAWLRYAILSTGERVIFAKNSHEGYHGLTKCGADCDG